MANWKFWNNPIEKRESSLTDEIVQRILARAEGGVSLPTSTASSRDRGGNLGA